MSSFKPLNTKIYQKTEKVLTPDNVYWKCLDAPTFVKEFGAIDYIDFSSIEPFNFAVTCSVRVQIYNPITKLVVKNLSRFQETAYGGTFRQDGRLLVAGDEQGLVKLFDTASKNVLRLFKGHKAPVHRTYFTQDLLRIASFSDDKTVGIWDISSERAIHSYAEHEDYVRAGAVNPVSKDILISGGYDGKIKFYDTRTQEVQFTVDHEKPVESLLFLPSGGIFLSAGGTEVRVWDAFAGGRLMTKMSHHHKTITCLRLASNGKRIISGGLDRHVKIYDVATYKTVHSLDFPNSVLSLGVAPNDRTVVAGLVDGLISIQNMGSGQEKENKKTRSSRPIDRKSDVQPGIKIDHEIIEEAFEKGRIYDGMLKHYEYVKVLDKVLTRTKTNREPELVVGILQELIRRKGLHRALVGRSNESLVTLINFICRNISEHRFMRVLIDVATILIDAYEDQFHQLSVEVNKQFARLAEVLQKEIKLTHDLMELQGALETLFTSAEANQNSDGNMLHFVPEKKLVINQSSSAKESSILKI